MSIIYANNVAGILASSVVASDPLILLGAGQGIRFPAPGTDEYFYATIIDSTTGQVEVVKCTARNLDTLTVERGRDGTTAISFAAGAVVEMRLTAIMLRESDYNLVRGVANGLASLDATLAIPVNQIPPAIARVSALAAYVPNTARAAANGIATLDHNSDVPDAQIPSNIARTSALSAYIQISTRGQANGVATLDGSGNVPSSQMPALNYVPTSGGSISGSLTVGGALTVDDVTVSSDEVRALVYNGTTNNVYLASGTASGAVTLRPNGRGSTSGQAILSASGLLTVVDMRGGSDIRFKKRVRKHAAREDLADKLSLSTWLWKHSGEPGIGEIAQRVIEFAPEYVSLGEDDRYFMDKAGLALEAVIGLASRVRKLESQTCSTNAPLTTRSRSSNAPVSKARKSPRSSK